MSDYKDIFANLLVKTHFAVTNEEVVSEVADEPKHGDAGEYDYEGDMAKSQLKSIIVNAQRLHDMLDDDTNLPEWVQSKITLAEDYVLTAANYMEGEMNEEVEQIDEGGHIYTKHPKTGELHRVGSFKEMPLKFYDHPTKPTPSAKEIDTALARINPHLDAEHIKAIRMTSGASNPVGKYFVNHSDNAVGKKYIKQELKIREEVEQIDELKKSTLKSYVKKATKEMKKAHDYHQMRYGGRDGSDPEYMKKTYPAALAKYDRRDAGVEKAKEKLTKEETEIVDEKVRSPYAVGMAAAMKSTGDKPPLEKSTIKKAHKIAKKVMAKEEVRYFSGTTVSGKAWKFIPPGEPKMLSPEFVKDRVPTLTDNEAKEVSVVAKDQYNDVEKKFAEMSEAKGGTVPKTAKEKDLAAKAHPKHLITRKDVLHARGVKLGEEDLREKMREKMFGGKTMTKKQADPVVFHPMSKKKQSQK